MIDRILNEAAANAGSTSYPSAYYSQDGDCVFFYNEGGEYIRHRVDRLLTVYRNPDDQRILGLQVKGISKLPPHDGISVEVREKPSRKGKRVDIVRVLLLSYREESCEREDEERTDAYLEALHALGCNQMSVELV